MSTETHALTSTSPYPSNVLNHPLMQGVKPYAAEVNGVQYTPILFLMKLLGDAKRDRALQIVQEAGLSVHHIRRNGSVVAHILSSDLEKWLSSASKRIERAKRSEAPAGELTSSETILINLGMLFGTGALSEAGLREIVTTLRREGALHSSLPALLGKPVLEEAPPKVLEAAPAVESPVPDLPVASPAEGQTPGALLPTDVIPEGFLSATSVVTLMKDFDAQIAQKLATGRLLRDPLPEDAQVLRMLHNVGVLEEYHRRAHAPLQKRLKSTPFARPTLAKTVGEVARSIRLYPLPYKDGYTPPENLSAEMVQVYHLNKAKEEAGKVVPVPVSAYAVYHPKAVLQMYRTILETYWPAWVAQSEHLLPVVLYRGGGNPLDR